MPYKAEQRGQMYRVVNEETGAIARMPDPRMPEATIPADGGGYPEEIRATARAMELNDTELKTGDLEDMPTEPGAA